MSGSVNIGNVVDPNYRYKMPVLQTKIEGRGNGIKTVITNMTDIARALHIHPAYPTKYFGIELGAQSKYSALTERAIVNGAHTANDMSKLLDRMIQVFILCPTCKLPEISMKVSSSSIKIDCAACGANSVLKTPHKLAAYIIKNPPAELIKQEKEARKKEKKVQVVNGEVITAEDEQRGGDGEKKKAGKRQHKGKGAKDTAGGGAGSGSAEEDGTEVGSGEEEEVEEKEPVKEKKKKDKSSSSAAAGAGGSTDKPKKSRSKSEESEESEEEWFTDTSVEAQRARQEDEFKEAVAATKKNQALLSQAGTDSKVDSPVLILKMYLAGGKRSPTDILAEAKRVQMARGLDEPTKWKILLESLLDLNQPLRTVPTQLSSQAELLRSIAHDRQSSLVLLSCLEELVGVVDKRLLPYIPHILKELYDVDVLEEEVIVEWAEAPPESAWRVNKEVAALVRGKAMPFVEGLKNAADDDGDEEDEA